MKNSAIHAGLFKKWEEVIHLGLPIALLIAIGYDIFFSRNFIYVFDRWTINFLIDVVLLNVTHNAFTYMMLISSPQLKVWMVRRGGVGKFWRNNLLLTGGLALAFYFVLAPYSKSPWIYTLFTFINLLIPAHHALAQSYGISLLYNYAGRRNRKIEAVEKRERSIYGWFLGLTLIGLVALFFNWNGLLAQRFPEIGSIRLEVLVAWTLGLLFLLLMGGTISLPKELRATKGLFYVRFLIWALSFISMMAVFATRIIHGIEYLFISRRILSADKILNITISAVLLLLVIGMGVIRTSGFSYLSERAPLPHWVAALTAISTAISFSHYYLDRQLFRMKDAETREIVGPLLKG